MYQRLYSEHNKETTIPLERKIAHVTVSPEPEKEEYGTRMRSSVLFGKLKTITAMSIRKSVSFSTHAISRRMLRDFQYCLT